MDRILQLPRVKSLTINVYMVEAFGESNIRVAGHDFLTWRPSVPTGSSQTITTAFYIESPMWQINRPVRDDSVESYYGRHPYECEEHESLILDLMAGSAPRLIDNDDFELTCSYRTTVLSGECHRLQSHLNYEP